MVEQESIAIETADNDGQEATIQLAFKPLNPAELLAWLKVRKPELALLLGMTSASVLVAGAALAVLLSPNLGQKLTYDPLIDEATLAANTRSSLGEQILGQVARVLEIEIIETQGPGVGHRRRPVPSMVIVAQADQAVAMPEADLAVGLRAMVLAAGVGLGVTGLMRLMPRIPFSALGPRRRQPLSQRLTATEVADQPLAPVVASSAARATRTITSGALIPGALNSLAVPPFGEEVSRPGNSPGPAVRPAWRDVIAHVGQQRPRLRRKGLRRIEQALEQKIKPTIGPEVKQTRRIERTSVRGSEAGIATQNIGVSQVAKPDLESHQSGVNLASVSPAMLAHSISFVSLSSLSPVSAAGKPNSPSKPKALLPSIGAVTAKASASTVSAPLDFLDNLKLRKQCHRV